MSQPSLLVRTDGGPSVGVGHLARCLALVQAWVDAGGRATLVSTSPPDTWATRYRREGVQVRPDLPAEARYEWAVLDGYRFGPADADALRSVAPLLLVVDDHGTSGLTDADVLVDQNLDATDEPYAAAGTDAELLLGTRYALLRREFRTAPVTVRHTAAVARRLLVTLGGAPPDWAEGVVRAALEQSPEAFEVTFLKDVDNVPAAMAAADLAVSAAGSTCWELCRMGLPSVLLAIAPNQVPLAGAMARHGAAVVVTADTLPAAVRSVARDPQRRAEMSCRGIELVDGLGAQRVVEAMRSRTTVKEHA